MKLTRMTLKINGVERFVLCDPEKDNLAAAIRRLGLTGTKVGCGTGVCGACSVILNGKVVRSCTRKMKSVAEFSEITTIEGVGTPQHLHPLQQAWITYGGVQCGFCSPGFIVSAYQLLKENASPTREDVRAWFQKHRNICRCTGYKPLVDSVMAAAEVMRGEKTMADITYDAGAETDIYGSKRPRPSALGKVTGLTDYGDDVKLKMPAGTLHCVPVISELPHAKIRNIDISEAEKMPGVVKVLVAKDIPGTNNIDFPAVIPRTKGKGITEFPIICGDVVNKRGDVLALVCAETQDQARAAAKAVKCDLEELPSYLTFIEAAMPNAVRLHKDLPNFYLEQPVYKGEDTLDLFESAEDDGLLVAEGSFHSQHEPHLPIEPDVVQGYYDSEGKLTIQCKAQAITEAREGVHMSCGIPMENIRVIMNPVGGSFGYSVSANTYAIVATAVQNLDMPCSLSLTYDQFMHVTGKRSASFTNGRIAVTKDGKIVAAEYDVGLECGAYGSVGSKIFHNVVSVGFHGYNIPNFKGLGRGVTTNNAFCTPYRGFGAPQIYTATEALIDMAAQKIGMDPWEFRYKNAARPGDLTINSREYQNYPYVDLLEKIKPVYDEYKALAEKGKAEGKDIGVGLSLGGFLVTIGFIDAAEVALELEPDGSVRLYDTWEDVGQGGDIGSLTHAVKALNEAGYPIKPENVKLTMNDSKTCPDTGLAAASRSHYMAGHAFIDAAKKFVELLKKPDGTFRTYEELKAEGKDPKVVGHYDQFGLGLPPGLDPDSGEGRKDPAFMYGVNVALVEVNKETGKTQVLKYTCVSDVGVVGNRLAVEGQAYGGLSHSIGFALSEDYMALDKHGNMAGAGIPTIDAVPDDFNVVFVENPRDNGPFGSCGCSECYQSSGHMAVINAINNAIGARVYDLPATPDKVKKALADKAAGNEVPPKYYLGVDFEEELEYIRQNPFHK